ncbi:MAG: CshA/CshB family fibrillar adhesin-related protein [Acidimicrobiales bacterium]
MSNPFSGRPVHKPFGRGWSCSRGKCWRRPDSDQHGFTLIELLLVLVILPVVVGALSYGLLSIFSLQSGVSSRLTDTEDAQVVEASYANDVQSAYNITTEPTITDSCGTITGQILGVELDKLTNAAGDVFPGETISYVVVSATSTAVSLERLECDSAAGATTTSETTLAYDVSSASIPSINLSCSTAFEANNSAGNVLCTTTASEGWTPAFEFSQVILPVTEAQTSYNYTLVAAPAASTSASDSGSVIGQTSTTSCSFASQGSGQYAGNLCFVDFSSLTGGAYTAATDGGCLEMSAAVGGGDTLYFCLKISGVQVGPYALPVYQEAFLGNTNSESGATLPNVPFYINVPGEPALYTDPASGSAHGGTTTITFTGISVVTSSGQLATGWQVFSADAESTDNNEYVQWTTTPSTSPLSILANGLSVDSSTDPVGNACGIGQGLYYINTVNGVQSDYPYTSGGVSNGGKYNEVECQASSSVVGDSYSTTGNDKDGAAMVTSLEPETMTITMQANGLQGIVFGLFES